MEKNKICVLGSANVDSFVYVSHIPVPGQTIQAENYMIANGGKGANQAVAAGKLAGYCIFAGQVGEDDEMRNLKKQMTQNHVQLSWRIRKDVTTGKAFIYVDENSGQNSIVIVGGANTKYEAQTSQLPAEYLKAIDTGNYLLLQKQVPVKINELAAKYAKSKGKTVILDCGGRDQPIPKELLQNLDYISPNQTQLLRIDPDIDVNNIVGEIRTKLISKYPKLKVLLKLGSKGSAMITDKHYIVAPIASSINSNIANQYKIIDTVGAGDCFTAAFAVQHSELNWTDEGKVAENYRKSMIFGNSSAFLCITRKGAMPSMPQRNQVDKFMQKYGII